MGAGTHHAKWLRGVLVAERDRRGWSLSQAARAIARELQAVPSDTPGRRGKGLTKQSLQAWEEFRVQPKIDQFAAWARAMGLRLEVDLAPRDESTVIARVPQDVADIALELTLVPAEERARIVGLAREIAKLDVDDREYIAETVRRIKRGK